MTQLINNLFILKYLDQKFIMNCCYCCCYLHRHYNRMKDNCYNIVKFYLKIFKIDFFLWNSFRNQKKVKKLFLLHNI